MKLHTKSNRSSGLNWRTTLMSVVINQKYLITSLFYPTSGWCSIGIKSHIWTRIQLSWQIRTNRHTLFWWAHEKQQGAMLCGLLKKIYIKQSSLGWNIDGFERLSYVLYTWLTTSLIKSIKAWLKLWHTKSVTLILTFYSLTFSFSSSFCWGTLLGTASDFDHPETASPWNMIKCQPNF